MPFKHMPRPLYVNVYFSSCYLYSGSYKIIYYATCRTISHRGRVAVEAVGCRRNERHSHRNFGDCYYSTTIFTRLLFILFISFQSNATKILIRSSISPRKTNIFSDYNVLIRSRIIIVVKGST